MKKNLLLTLTIIMTLSLSAQTQRLVLIEEATNASCGPCAQQNPAFMALLNANRHKITAVMYHWYFPGYDPMHLHNVVENNGRVSYYGINGVPTAVIDGVIPSGAGFGYPGGPHGFTQALIDQYYAVPSPFEIDMYHYLSAGEDSIHVFMRIRAVEDISFSGVTKAQIAVIEKTITFSSPPGSNGEMVFHDVMKKMLPTHLGTNIPAEWEEGDYLILNESWKLANIYDMDELGVVGFIQQSLTKTVEQAGNSNDQPFSPYYTTDAALLSLSNLHLTNCSGVYEPVISIANYGSDPLTSMDIVYQVNDEDALVFNWTGNLGFLESEQVELPVIAFNPLPENELQVNLENVNGLQDEYPKNNTIIYSFNRAVATPNEVKLKIRLDSNPQEITWNVKNMDGEIVFSGGPYTTPGVMIDEVMLFDDLGCHVFNIYDEGGDGLLAPGFFMLYHGSNTQIVSGTTFGSHVTAQFDVGGTLNIDSPEFARDINFYPNPIQNYGILNFRLETKANVEISIFNLVGQEVKQVRNGDLEAGIHQVYIEAGNLKTGLYILSARINDNLISRKISVIR
jgi:hypothetical protein